MALRPGEVIWIECEVKPGAFSDERMIRIATDFGDWVGFVDVKALREPIAEGATTVRGTIVEVEGETFSAALPGHSVGPGMLRESSGKAIRMVLSRAHILEYLKKDQLRFEPEISPDRVAQVSIDLLSPRDSCRPFTVGFEGSVDS